MWLKIQKQLGFYQVVFVFTLSFFYKYLAINSNTVEKYNSGLTVALQA